ncbi:MAG TPA: hypothetical protein VFT12_04120 [Thermoanaerobaculia bacterium]|nr:hypothetical protein [Thermoanaerobaculia bacterium]
MSGRRSWLAPFVFFAAVAGLSVFAQHGLAQLGTLRRSGPVMCAGSSASDLRIVYLHGLDSYGPSWIEIRNRETLRALAHVLHARIAFPRARGGWPQQTAASLDTLRSAVGNAARTCFGKDSEFGILGFSDGGNAVNQLHLQCDPRSPWMVSVGSEASLSRRTDTASRAHCGTIALIAGEREPTYLVSRGFAQQLAKRGAKVRFFEHPGVHELPFAATRDALEWAAAQ